MSVHFGIWVAGSIAVICRILRIYTLRVFSCSVKFMNDPIVHGWNLLQSCFDIASVLVVFNWSGWLSTKNDCLAWRKNHVFYFAAVLLVTFPGLASIQIGFIFKAATFNWIFRSVVCSCRYVGSKLLTGKFYAVVKSDTPGCCWLSTRLYRDVILHWVFYVSTTYVKDWTNMSQLRWSYVTQCYSWVSTALPKSSAFTLVFGWNTVVVRCLISYWMPTYLKKLLTQTSVHFL